MDWSATLSLTTSRARQHRANYGSFRGTTPLSRSGSGTTISIPESIPEHQCVVQFSSPRMQDPELDQLDADTSNFGRLSGSTTMTITETKSKETNNTFKMLLTSSSTSASINGSRIDTNTDTDHASSYWLQERERMMLKRKQRFLRQNGSPTKAATLREESSGWRTAAIMCSVPLVLIVVFVVIVLVFGDGSDAPSGMPHWLSVHANANTNTNSRRLRGLDANS